MNSTDTPHPTDMGSVEKTDDTIIAERSVSAAVLLSKFSRFRFSRARKHFSLICKDMAYAISEAKIINSNNSCKSGGRVLTLCYP